MIWMTLAALDPAEREIVRKAMQAMFRFFDEDFGSRLGVTEEVMRRLLEDWPNIDDKNDESDGCLAVNNSLNDLLHGIGISEQQANEVNRPGFAGGSTL
jgi:hypothetical protein